MTLMGPVLCCLDDSAGARHALAVARLLASQFELELVLVHVEPPTEAPGVSAAPAGQQRLRERELVDGESLLAHLIREAGIDADVRSQVAIGSAAERIVALCTEEQASFVVLGSRGRAGIASALLGSVSSEVAAKAPCPCVIVPPRAAQPAPQD
jgi:nucleotide-binding universal stress UspA family protein